MSRLFKSGVAAFRLTRNKTRPLKCADCLTSGNARQPRQTETSTWLVSTSDAGQSLRTCSLHVNLNGLADILEGRFHSLALRHATGKLRHVRHVPLILKVKKQIYEKASFFTHDCILARKVEADGASLVTINIAHELR